MRGTAAAHVRPLSKGNALNPSNVYVSIDDVVPIDPDKAGKTITDYLETFGQITFFSLIGLAVLSLIVAIVVAKKAGYSGWWGAISVLFPPLGIVLVVLLALLKWPALKQRDEALGILAANDLMLPSEERKAIKIAERRRAEEEAARKRMEKAQAAREQADVAQARFAAAEAKRAADASTVAAAASVASLEAPADTQKGDAKADAADADTAATEAAPPASADAAAKPLPEHPGSVAPKVRTVRPRTTTNATTTNSETATKAPSSKPQDPPPPPPAG